MMMNETMDGVGSMMWGTGWAGLLIAVLVVLGVAALAKYLLFNKRPTDEEKRSCRIISERFFPSVSTTP
jgi:hypothetical protein